MHPRPKTIIYDCEIFAAMPPKRQAHRQENIVYCKGWDDFAGMGITCIGVYDYYTESYRVFGKETLHEFQALCDARTEIIGFNSVAFDDKLCAANGLTISTTWDVLVEVWRAAGLALQYAPGTGQSSYSLDKLAQANLGEGKTENGGFAPVLWQMGEHARVIDYCLRDVMLTKRLFESRDDLCDPFGNALLMCPYDWKGPREPYSTPVPSA